MTLSLQQKRDLLRKTPAVPDTSLDDFVHPEDLKAGVGLGTSPSGRMIFLDIPEDTVEPLTSLEGNNNDEEEYYEEDDEDLDDSDFKPDDDENDEAEFKIQIVPRQRKQRKIAVSAIQREYLDISFNTLDKLGEQPTDTGKRDQGQGRQEPKSRERGPSVWTYSCCILFCAPEISMLTSCTMCLWTYVCFSDDVSKV